MTYQISVEDALRMPPLYSGAGAQALACGRGSPWHKKVKRCRSRYTVMASSALHRINQCPGDIRIRKNTEAAKRLLDDALTLSKLELSP